MSCRRQLKICTISATNQIKTKKTSQGKMYEQETEIGNMNGEMQNSYVEMQHHNGEMQNQETKLRFQCRMCDKPFHFDHNRKKHEVKVHKYYHISRQEFQCSECLALFSSEQEIKNHLNTDHEYLNIKLWMLYFRSEEEFITWKTALEVQTISTYTFSDISKTKDFIIKNYKCHRSGNVRNLSTGGCYLEPVESNETGFFCPASISMKKCLKKDAFLEVTYVETHVGHDCKASNVEKSSLSGLISMDVQTLNMLHTISDNSDFLKPNSNVQDLDCPSTSCELPVETIRVPIEFQGQEIILLEGSKRLLKIQSKSASEQMLNQIESTTQREMQSQEEEESHDEECQEEEESQEKEENLEKEENQEEDQLQEDLLCEDEEMESHNDKMHKPESSTKVQCRICDKYFNYHSNRRKHEKRMHKYYPTPKTDFQCSECLKIFPTRIDINRHLNTDHKYLNIKRSMLYFKSEEEFLTWKTTIEEQTVSTYSCLHTNRTKNGKTRYFNCHRSGYFQSSGAGKRRLKYIGSNKTGFFCPASIYMKKYKDENKPIEVTFVETHVAHAREVGRQKLSLREKSTIASLMKEGVPYSYILEKFSENAPSSKKVPKMDDLRNISISYGLRGCSRKVRVRNDD